MRQGGKHSGTHPQNRQVRGERASSAIARYEEGALVKPCISKRIMCGTNPSLPPAANAAKNLSIAVFVLGLLNLISFIASALGGWLSGIGALLAVVAASLIMCCAPAAPGAGTGFKYKGMCGGPNPEQYAHPCCRCSPF